MRAQITRAQRFDRSATATDVQFHWKRDEFPEYGLGEGRQVGFIAQEVAEVLPQVIASSWPRLDTANPRFAALSLRAAPIRPARTAHQPNK